MQTTLDGVRRNTEILAHLLATHLAKVVQRHNSAFTLRQPAQNLLDSLALPSGNRRSPLRRQVLRVIVLLKLHRLHRLQRLHRNAILAMPRNTVPMRHHGKPSRKLARVFERGQLVIHLDEDILGNLLGDMKIPHLPPSQRMD